MQTYHQKGDSVAITFNNFSLSFPKFFKEIDRVAAGFYKLGIRKGDIVMISLPNIPQSVVATYAISKIGAIASMVHPKVPAKEFSKYVKQQKPKLILLSDMNYPKFKSECKGIKKVFCSFLTYSFFGLPHAKGYEEYIGDGSEPMFYIQSGGTSGVPKTVVLSSKSCNAMAYNLLNYLDDRFSEKTAMLSALPFFHCFGLGAGMHAPLCANMGITLLPIFSAEKATKLIEKSKITCMLAVPRMVNKLLDYSDFASDKIKTLCDVFVGGDSVSSTLKTSFNKTMTDKGLQAQLFPGYGLSESSISFLSKEDAPDDSIGKPLINIDYKLVDENLNEVGIGNVGELLLSSDQQMSYYLDDDGNLDKQKTDETLIDIDGKKYVKTGDCFKEDEQGFFYFMGRKKRLIKISGMNVFPSEIERVAKQLPYISECVAIEGKKNNKNYIKLLVEGNISDNQKKELKDYITNNLSHWNTPSSIVCIDNFYRTKLAKIDIERLQNEYQKD